MPYFFCNGNKIELDEKSLNTITQLIQIKKGDKDTLDIQEAYVLSNPEKDVFLDVNKDLCVILRVNDKPPKFIHIWGDTVKEELLAFSPVIADKSVSIRFDQHCRIEPIEWDTYYERY